MNEPNQKQSKFYLLDGGKAYHENKHFVSEKQYSLISKHRLRKLKQFISPNHKILEYGVGGGWNIFLIECQEKLGYDISTTVNEILCSKGIPFENSSINIPKEYFDIVICHHVLEHTLNPNLILREISGFLKQDGKLLLYVPIDRLRKDNSFNINDEDHHLYAWNVQTICALAEESGFIVKKYKRAFFGYDKFISRILVKFSLPNSLFIVFFYLLNLIRPVREIQLVLEKSNKI